MKDHPRSHAWRAGLAIVLASALGLPAPARATDGDSCPGFDLRLRPPAVMFLARKPRGRKPPARKPPVPAAQDEPALPLVPTPDTGATAGARPDLAFDLLGPSATAATPVAVDEGKVRLRRKLLTYHPLLGIGLLACETATVVVGQLNYSDRFGGGPSSGRYERLHAALAGSTALLFVGTGLLALLAPNPMPKAHQGLDRVLLHKIGMFTATAGMATEIALGIYTTRREGFANQESFARAHLVVGYITLAATYLGVGSIAF